MDPQKIGNAIQILRKRLGYTQFYLADMLGVTDKAVSKWERGLSVPDIGIITKLSLILNCDVDNLLEGNISYLEENWQGLFIISEESQVINSATNVYGKPLVYLPLSYFMLAGIKIIYILCSEQEKLLIKNIIGDEGKFGIQIFFISEIRQLEKRNTMVIHGFSFFYGSNLTRYFQRAMAKQNRIVMLTVSKENYGEKRISVNYDNYKVVQNSRESNCYLTNISFFPAGTIENIEQSFDLLIQSRQLYAEPMGNGMIQYQIETTDDILVTSNLMHLIKLKMGNEVYDLYQIAKNRNLIK